MAFIPPWSILNKSGAAALILSLCPAPFARADDDFPELALLPPIHAAMATAWHPPARSPMPVGVIINGQPLADPCLIAMRDGSLFVGRDIVRQWGITLPDNENDISIDGTAFAPISGLSGLSARLDEGRENLLIDADPALFPAVRIGRTVRSLPVATPVSAQFIGYDLALSQWQGRMSAAALIDAGFSGGWGVVGTTALAQSEGQGFTRLTSAFQRDFPDRALRLTLGDTLSQGGSWNRPVRFAGVRLGTDFSLTPDDITYPLPVLSGSAALPSTVELAAASSRQMLDVRPGAFAIDYQPAINGAGEINMTIRDATGQARSVTRSFYTSQRLLRAGLSDFSLEAGALRRDYGQRNFAYGAPFVGAALRHGVTGGVTLSGRVEGDDRTRAAGIGMGIVIMPVGEFSLSAAASRGSGGSGTLARAAFQRITPLYAITASYSQESGDFAQVGEDERSQDRRTELAITGSLTLGQLGNINAHHIESDLGDGQRFATDSLSYAANIGGAYLLLGARRTRHADVRSDTLFGSLTLPLGQRSSAALFADQGRMAASFSRTPPPDAGMGYRFQIAQDRATDQVQAEGGVSWRTAAGEIDLSAARNGRSGGVRLQARGALLVVDGTVMAAPRIDYAFALVDVLSDQEASLYLENRPVARRAGNGKRAIITGLLPYGANRISVDLDSLPMDAMVTSPEQSVVPGYRQAVKIRFGAEASHPMTLRLVDERGAPLPVGLAVSGGGESPGVTGHDGAIFLADARPGDRIRVDHATQACEAIVPTLPVGLDRRRVDPVPCTPIAPERG